MMASEVTRYVKPEVQCELWGRAAGRCQFSGCNRPLYKSPITQERVNLGEKAHIFAFSPRGPRGRGPLKPKSEVVNGISNLLLVCHDCHKTIDRDPQGTRYTPTLLQSWKQSHEERVRVVTGISQAKRSHVVLYGSRIGDERSPLQFSSAAAAMFPDWYPAADTSVDLSMQSLHDDSTETFWRAESENLLKAFERQVRPLIEEGEPNHFSIFALASQPLLTLLGSLFTDKVPAVVYQPHREPRTWKWQSHSDQSPLRIREPVNKSCTPVLVVSLSARIAYERITAVVGDDVAIWELTVDDPHNDFLQSEAQLRSFSEAARKVMVAIMSAHRGARTLMIFPAMPAACAVELGRIRMPKADLGWTIYDQNHRHQRFIPALTIGEPHE